MLGERITGHLIWGYSDLLGCAGGEIGGHLVPALPWGVQTNWET